MKKSNLKIKISLIFLIIFLIIIANSCDNFEDRLYNAIEDKFENQNLDTCYIILEELIGEDYDSLFVLSQYTPFDEFRDSSRLFDYKRFLHFINDDGNGTIVEEGNIRVIFIKDNDIVYENEFFHSKIVGYHRIDQYPIPEKENNWLYFSYSVKKNIKIIKNKNYNEKKKFNKELNYKYRILDIVP